jgi:hypothetical protein
VLMFIGMTSVFLAERCQGDGRQGQQSVLKIAKSTVEVYWVWHVATDTGGQIRLLCVTACTCVRDRERARDLHRDAQILPCEAVTPKPANERICCVSLEDFTATKLFPVRCEGRSWCPITPHP